MSRERRERRRLRANERGIKLAGIGGAVLLISIPLLVWVLGTDLPGIIRRIGPFILVDIYTDINWLPDPSDGEFDLATWIADIGGDFVTFGLTAGYYLLLFAVIVGFSMLLYGLSMVHGAGQLFDEIADWTGNPMIQLMIGAYLLFFAALFVPTVMRVMVELTIAIAVGGTLFLLFGGAWWWLHSEVAGRMRIAVVYPLGIAAVILPIAVTAVLSPTFATSADWLSNALAIVLLDSIFAIGGLNEWLRATFDLDGLGYVGFWLGIAMALGWLIGFIVEWGFRGLVRT